MRRGRRNITINKKAVLAAATIVFSLSLSSSNVLSAERVPVVQITESEEKTPQTLYFSYADLGESDNITVPEEDMAMPAFSEEQSETSLKLTKTIPFNVDITVQQKEQTDPKVDEQVSYKQYAVQQVKDASVKQLKKFTDAEKAMIAKVVYAEARGECFDGQVAVAQVVINRYKSGRFGSTVKRIVYGRHQFAVGKRYTKACMEAVEYAIENMPYPTNMYFFQVSKNRHWRKFIYFNRIGNHSFYCLKVK